MVDGGKNEIIGDVIRLVWFLDFRPKGAFSKSGRYQLVWFQDVLVNADSLCCWESWMEDCCTPNGSAVQEGFAEGIEPPNSVDDIWGTRL